MNNVIELTGVDHGEALLINPAHLMAVITSSSLSGAPKGARSQVFMQGGLVLHVKETVASIKSKLGVPSVGDPAFTLPEPPGSAANSIEVQS